MSVCVSRSVFVHNFSFLALKCICRLLIHSLTYIGSQGVASSVMFFYLFIIVVCFFDV